METRVDAHCHLFNGRYVLHEALAALESMVRGEYRLHEQFRGKAVGVGLVPPPDQWSSIIGRIADLYAPAVGSCPENYGAELEGYEASDLATEGLFLFPLMMDAFYMFAPEQPADEAPAAATPVTDDWRELFAEHAAAIGERVVAAVSADVRSGVAQEIEGVIAQHVEALHDASRGLAAPAADSAGIQLSAGYAEHLGELEKLAGAHAGQVFPFLAVDPRRDGIADLLKRKVSRHGPFYGVKLYPPLGYYPNHPVLQEVYAYCLSEDLPITVHAQPSSFPHAGYTKVEAGLKFANPCRWAPILEKHQGLRVNFAHFGGIGEARAYSKHQDQEGNWTRTIVGLMDHPNVYADTAAFAEPDTAQIVDGILRRESDVAERLMFGTDYVICLLNPNVKGCVEKYFNCYPSIAGSSYGPALFHDNALRFVNAR